MRIGLGLTEVGRSELRQHLSRLHDFAGLDEDLDDASGEGGKEANGLVLVPGEPPGQPDRAGVGVPRDLGYDRAELRTVLREEDAIALDRGCSRRLLAASGVAAKQDATSRKQSDERRSLNQLFRTTSRFHPPGLAFAPRIIRVRDTAPMRSSDAREKAVEFSLRSEFARTVQESKPTAVDV